MLARGVEVSDMNKTNGREDHLKLLFAKKAELVSSLRTKLDMLAGPMEASPEDQAPVFHDHFVALRINQLDNLQLKLVEAALARVDSGDYGICVDCGDPISSGRLRAIPWTNRCIACQERSIPAHDSEQLAEPAPELRVE
jgi:DnaK suppressor protein